MHTPLSAFARFGYVNCMVGVVACLGAMVVAGPYWDWYRYSVGLPLHTSLPLTAAPRDRPIILEEQCATVPGGAPALRLNGTAISADSIPGALRRLLAVRADHVVYIDGEGCLEIGDVARLVETARDSWEGVRVVLLTPETRRWLERAP